MVQDTKSHRVNLTDAQYRELDSHHPKSKASGPIGKRAEEIVKIYFRKMDPACEFRSPPRGADLDILLSSGKSIVIEVKGTASIELAWPQLKVSSQDSWKLLAEKHVPVYRVTDVFGRSPSIYVLTYGEDFTLQAEPRWTFKQVK